MRQACPFERQHQMYTVSASTASHCSRRTCFLCRSLARHRRGARNADNAQHLRRTTRMPNAFARLRQCARHVTRACLRTETLRLTKCFEKVNMFGRTYDPRVRAQKFGVRLTPCAPTCVPAVPKRPSRALGALPSATAMRNACVNHIGRVQQCE